MFILCIIGLCVPINIESSLVVGWLEVELSSVLRYLWSLLYEEGVWAVNYCNRVDYEVICGLINYDMKCMNVLCANLFTPDMLRVM